MRLVHDLKLLTNPKAKEKALSLRVTQDQFLHQMETCITWEIATIDLVDQTFCTSFCAVLMNIPDPTEPTAKLFHLVNITFNWDGYIFRFHPSRSQMARDVVAGLLVFLTGIWSGLVDPTKFHKFFSATAIERAQDAWWDAKDKCVVTLADKELDNLLKADPDMAFTAPAVEVDTSNLPLTDQTSNKVINSGLLSSSSVSTFRTAATTKTNLKSSQSKGHVPTNTKSSTSATSALGQPDNQVSAVTSTTGLLQSDLELKQLLMCLLQALQPSPPPNPSISDGLPGGPKSRTSS